MKHPFSGVVGLCCLAMAAVAANKGENGWTILLLILGLSNGLFAFI